ncbi:coiled-coil domain containing 89 [Columba livia]|uniref:Coiled-coil domain containing 89 n=1 Tax=Columba livia TaxID=8932 RepID=A0A2I0M0Z8_COLLI|nr:coiled-coil domain containing 89 [Columba livia]
MNAACKKRGSVAQDEREVGMANPRSDPEMDKDMEDLTKGLEELSESPEEKSKRALLHSHLEQQHHLICILKKKADDARKRCRGLEQLNVELENLRTEDAVKMKSQMQRIQYLEKCFMDLAKSHEQMVQFKNEHRKQHMQLWEENKCLRQENEKLFSQAGREKEAKVLQLAAQPGKLLQQVESLQKNMCLRELQSPGARK